MSPEDDGKLLETNAREMQDSGIQYVPANIEPIYATDTANTPSQSIDTFLNTWRQIPGKLWDDDNPFEFIPGMEDQYQYKLAFEEAQAITETFYTHYRLPVITPSNVDVFVEKFAQSGLVATLWCWFSGSSQLLTTAMSAPFYMSALFPVDLRYGWDISDNATQLKLQQVDAFLKPKITTFEPRCRHWSQSGSRRNSTLTEQVRQSESSLHVFLYNHICNINKDWRLWLLENPKSSALFKKSALAALDYASYNSGNPTSCCDQSTRMCAFANESDGERLEKATRLKGNVRLFKCIRKCSCRLPHLNLHGNADNTTGKLTTKAAIFPKRFCEALCHDFVGTLTYWNMDWSSHVFLGSRCSLDFSLYPSVFSLSGRGSGGNHDSSAQPAAVVADERPLRQQLEEMDVSGFELIGGDARCHGVLTPETLQLVKASLLDIADSSRKTCSTLETGEGIRLIESAVTAPTTASSVLLGILAPMFNIYHMAFQTEATHVFLPEECKSSASSASDDLARTRDRLIYAIGADKGKFKVIAQSKHRDVADGRRTGWPVDAAELILLYGVFADPALERMSTANTRLRGKQPNVAGRPTGTPVTDLTEDDGDIKLQTGKRVSTKSSLAMDMRDLPRKLRECANSEERQRLLKGMHERFWHAPPADMKRLLEGSCLPRNIVAEGIKVADECAECRPTKARIHRPMLKGSLAAHFNEYVQEDLFFMFDTTFILFIDECIRWKAGMQLASKVSSELIRALMECWVRIWGAMENIVMDQEGGMLSSESTQAFERLQINRIVVGTEGSTTKGLVERHIALTKIALMKFRAVCLKAELDLSMNDMVQEVCMSQNLMLSYGNSTPQTALTGQTHRLFNPEFTTVGASVSALDTQPDRVESYLRGRLMAKQCILEGMMEDRYAQAVKIKQHKHVQEILVPGTPVDVWRRSARKDTSSWQGPGDLISVERRAGSAIVKLNGIPLLVPMQNLRKHVLSQFFFHCLVNAQTESIQEFFINPMIAQETISVLNVSSNYGLNSLHDENSVALLQLMDICDGQSPGSVTRVGLFSFGLEGFSHLPDKTGAAAHPVMKLCLQIFGAHIKSVDGVQYGTQIRHLKTAVDSKWTLLLQWQRNDRFAYKMKIFRGTHPLTFTNDFDKKSCLAVHSFSHEEEDMMKIIAEDEIDMSDLSTIPPANDSYGPMDWDSDDGDDNYIPPAPPRQFPPTDPVVVPQTTVVPPSTNNAGPSQTQPPTVPSVTVAPTVPPYTPNAPSTAPYIGPLRVPTTSHFPPHPPAVPSTSDDSFQSIPQVSSHDNPPPPPAGGSAPVDLENIRIPIPADVSPPPGPMFEPDIDMQGGVTSTRSTISSAPPALGPGRPPRLNPNPSTVIPRSSVTPVVPPSAPSRTGPSLPSAGSAATPLVPPSSAIPAALPSRARTPATPRKAKDTVAGPVPPTPVHMPDTDPASETEEDHKGAKRKEQDTSADSIEKQQISRSKRRETDDPEEHQPILPIANPAGSSSSAAASSSHMPMAQNADTHDVSVDSEATIPYHDVSTDTNATLPYEDCVEGLESSSAMLNIFLGADRLDRDGILQQWNSEEAAMNAMFLELSEEFEALSIVTEECWLIDVHSLEIFRVDDDTALLSESEIYKYFDLVNQADLEEIKQFVKFEIFKPQHVSEIKVMKGLNKVDCVWLRKWAVKGVKVKSRLCARGCFDRQKKYIDKHSSTASRLSQRLACSMAMINHYVDAGPTGNPRQVICVSLDIRGAFLQGLRFDELEKLAKRLGYEHRHERNVYIQPPENIWRLFRALVPSGHPLHISDKDRSRWLLLCLACMYGFTDAPLLFQFALIYYLCDTTEAIKSVYDDNHLYWLANNSDKSWISLTATVHVDDLMVVGTAENIQWLKTALEKRFGPLKQESLPFTHTGIEYEMIAPDILFQHQEKFIDKLELIKLESSRKKNSTDILSPVEQTVFRSHVCACLWATITRPDIISELNGLQQYLKEAQVCHMLEVNAVIRRLKMKNGGRLGLYYRRLTFPIRVCTVSDAAPANKRNDRAREGKAVCICEDRTGVPICDKDDFMINTTQISKLGDKMHLVMGSGSIAKRISSSTSHAETLAAAALIPMGQLVAMRLAEPELLAKNGGKVTPMYLLRIQEESLCPIMMDHIIDCMDVWDLACGKKGIPQDKSQRLAILAIREERRVSRIRRFYHVTTKYMLADILTKWIGHDSLSLLELLSCGRWTIAGPVRVRHGFGGLAKSSGTED